MPATTTREVPESSEKFPRHFWWGLLFWMGICLAVIFVRGERWEEGYERAQVLLGITPYPDGHPHHRWVWNGFSVHYYLTGALLWLTRSAELVCGSRQFIATLAIHLPVYVITWVVTRRSLPAHFAVILSFAGANTFFQSYMPIEPWANKATSGLIGMGWAFAVLAGLCAGRWRAAGLLFGLMPLIHLGQWPMVLLTTIATAGWLWFKSERDGLRTLVRWSAAGLLCCLVFAAAQRSVVVPDPESGAYYSEKDGHTVWAEYTTREDMHRALTDWPRFGAMGHSNIALIGFLLLALPVAWSEVHSRERRWPVLVLFAYGALSAAAIWFAQGVHGLLGTDVPYVVVSWMPYRLTIHVSMLLLCAVCAWGASAGRSGVSWAAIAALGWLALLPLWPHVLPEGIAQRYFSGPELALFALGGAAIPGLWHVATPWRAFRFAWLAMVAAALVVLLSYHRLAAAAILLGLAIAHVEQWAKLPVQPRLVQGLAGVLGVVVLGTIGYAQWQQREHLPVSAFEATMAEYLAAHSTPDDMVLTPLDEHYQMVLKRPVVATFETRQFMSYMKSLAATTDKLFADLYGVKDGSWYDWDLWMERTEADWQALGASYGFRFVVSKDFHPLHLPERLRGDGLVLYEVP